uniref:Nuclear factor of kappa light polypeptide gene enhancer in B-cells inhibitor-like 2 n=1 Tax=Cyanistes caeruleus TaxID=156563 RepID=A0A8C0U1Y0_CYACU
MSPQCPQCPQCPLSVPNVPNVPSVSRVCRALAQLSADPAPPLALALCERLGDSLARLGGVPSVPSVSPMSPQCPQCPLSVPNVPSVSRVCRALAQLSADPAPPLALALCERLGDSLARLGHFQRAADFYQRQLALAEAQGAPGRDLAVIHVSLAATFRDLGQHSRALQHFRRELELRRGEPLEVRGFFGILGSERPGMRRGRWGFPGFFRIFRWNRRNERGETPLHRACIEGDLKKVRLYLDQGHPVNPRDYCGWTPLHEAANHGHLGEGNGGHPVNPRDYCGWTPLHEAANHGHLGEGNEAKSRDLGDLG